MKADIPDKILINRGEDGKLHHSYWTTDQELVPFEDTLYIRKDTLIEWLQKEYETASWYDEKMRHVTGCVGDTSSSGKAQAYQAVIDKLNSM